MDKRICLVSRCRSIAFSRDYGLRIAMFRDDRAWTRRSRPWPLSMRPPGIQSRLRSQHADSPRSISRILRPKRIETTGQTQTVVLAHGNQPVTFRRRLKIRTAPIILLDVVTRWSSGFRQRTRFQGTQIPDVRLVAKCSADGPA